MIKRGFRSLIYLDDLLVLLSMNAFTKRRVNLLLEILNCFGLTINRKKSFLVPAHRFQHLGLVVDLRQRLFAAPRAKVVQVRDMSMQLAKFAAQHRRMVNKKVLSKMVGTAIALSPAIPAGRFHLLPLYDSLNANFSWHPSTMVRLTNAAYR